VRRQAVVAFMYHETPTRCILLLYSCRLHVDRDLYRFHNKTTRWKNVYSNPWQKVLHIGRLNAVVFVKTLEDSFLISSVHFTKLFLSYVIRFPCGEVTASFVVIYSRWVASVLSTPKRYSFATFKTTLNYLSMWITFSKS
jgi:hypothetical protein